MARKRRALFDPPSDGEALASPDTVIRGPKGGWMWKCAYCGRPATALTSAGLKVCYAHGGETAAQRDPLVVQAAAERGEVVRRPGRPLKHGMYARIPGFKVDDLIEEYLDSGIDPDDTDEDMLALRAQLSHLRELLPDLLEVHKACAALRERLQAALKEDLPSEGMDVERFLYAIERLDEVQAQVVTFDGMATKALRMIKAIEDRHKSMVMMAKIRAETRLKNAAAKQLDVFRTMLERLKKINQETLPTNQHEALMLRYAKELSEVPKNAVKGVKA